MAKAAYTTDAALKEVSQISYKEYPVDVPPLKAVPLVQAFLRAASNYEPVLDLNGADVFCHRLKVADKVVVRIVFRDGQEAPTLERLRPFVDEARSSYPRFDYDFLEVVRNNVFWLVDPLKLIWVDETEKYIDKSRVSTKQRSAGEDPPWWLRD